MTDPQHKPRFHLAPVTQDDTSEQNDAKDAVKAILAELFANLLRIARSRGHGGKFYDVWNQIVEVHEAMRLYHKAFGCGPGLDVFDDALDYRSDLLKGRSDEHLPEGLVDKFLAEAEVLDGSCQLIASRLLRQSTQEASGRRQMIAGSTRLQALAKNDGYTVA